MINNTNIIDYTTITGSENASSLSTPTILMASEKHIPAHAAAILPQNNLGFIANYAESRNQYAYGTGMNADICTLPLSDIKTQCASHEHRMQQKKERVKVQHLQTHTNLQNNRWTFYNLSAETEKDLTNKHINTINNNTNINNNNNAKNNIQNESAFVKVYDINDRNSIFISTGTEPYYSQRNSSNNNNIRFVPNRIGDNNNSNHNNHKCALMSDAFECALEIQQQQQQQQQHQQQQQQQQQPQPHRTEDQENAFRRIEDVHNYAKINPTNYSNGVSSSSSINDDDEDEEEYGEDDDADVGADEEDIEDDDDIIFVNNALGLANTRYDHFYRNMPINQKNKNVEPHRSGEVTKKPVANKRSIVAVEENRSVEQAVDEEDEDVETDVNVDIECSHARVQRETLESVESVVRSNNNHARRPMNAFLIFCKRHRAIVKERYKSLENRAITKILGDWWASLDVSDKKCFTNLAQQNKDAFFSANPNFKWYKLPARPCRTLATRPSNAERCVLEPEPGSGNGNDAGKPQAKARNENYFKLADVAQMGELSALLNNDRGKAAHSELQQALGETTEFLNAHIPVHHQAGKTIASKRKMHSENSFSSNSSEDDAIPKKTSRSCKGKIYQELKNSGQITIVAKKLPKNTQKPNFNQLGQTEINDDIHQNYAVAAECNNIQPSATVTACQNDVGGANLDNADTYLACEIRKRVVSETESLQSCDLANFDLEEKIKELPALNLELYLQRKRNTKKKKKFNTKKRNSNSISSNKSVTSIASATTTVLQQQNPSTAVATANKMQVQQSHNVPMLNHQQQQQAVGSQKRKARKESITRRDVSAIENEVASLIPLNTDFTTINGRYYFDEETEEASSSLSPKMPMTIPLSPQVARSVSDAIAQVSTTVSAGNDAAAAVANLTSLHSSSNIVDNNLNDSNNISSSTSDLFILAEVAANRTGSIN